jgi:hypothetical protein
MSGKQSLSALVRKYRVEDGPRLDAYLDYFRKLGTIDEAIEFACLGKDGKIHDHQYRVGGRKLEKARKLLIKRVKWIESCRSFDELFRLVELATLGIDRFGELAIYETSLRLGAYLKRSPKAVYVHAGTKKGCKALGVATTGGIVVMENLPKAVGELEPYHAENFLCIFKGELGGPSRTSKGRRPSGQRVC